MATVPPMTSSSSGRRRRRCARRSGLCPEEHEVEQAPTAAGAEAATLWAPITAGAGGDGEWTSAPRPADVVDARHSGPDAAYGVAATAMGVAVAVGWMATESSLRVAGGARNVSLCTSHEEDLWPLAGFGAKVSSGAAATGLCQQPYNSDREHRFSALCSGSHGNSTPSRPGGHGIGWPQRRGDSIPTAAAARRPPRLLGSKTARWADKPCELLLRRGAVAVCEPPVVCLPQARASIKHANPVALTPPWAPGARGGGGANQPPTPCVELPGFYLAKTSAPPPPARTGAGCTSPPPPCLKECCRQRQESAC